MTNNSPTTPSPILYLPHGGGPLPLLGDAGHTEMVAFLKDIPKRLGEPSAILTISAHWEETEATITSASRPGLFYDYYGFPPESYEIQYPASGDPQLAQEVFEQLQAAGIPARLDEQRGFDHGMFVPLKLMYPEAQIPCVQLSLLKGLDPEKHIALGKALSALRQKNVLVVGSGMSFHNLRAFFTPGLVSHHEDEDFDRWLVENCSESGLSPDEREKRLIEWENAPFARLCHPREEHLLPLHVCYGTACADKPEAEVVFNHKIMNKKVSALLWSREYV
jgi:aromatic ring-opening dioxygenase catalytic subunit (LigB family)